jgi:hypothetical protein
MNKKMASERLRQIPFSEELENAIENDAIRCDRSFSRQVVAVLKAHYKIGNSSITADLQMVGEIDTKGEESKVIQISSEKITRKKSL